MKIETPKPMTASSTISKPTVKTSTTTLPSSTTSTLQPEPITFTFTEGERIPAAQEIPEFHDEEKQKAKTEAATLGEQRGAGQAAIAALVMPLFEIINRVSAGEPALPGSPADFKLNTKDADNLAQAILLVDTKHGGVISKSFGSDEYGAELFLAGVSIGIGFKVFMMFRSRIAQRVQRPKSAAPSQEEIPRKPIVQQATEGLKNLFTPKVEEKKEEVPGETRPMTPEEFDDWSKDRMRELENAG